MGEGLGHLALGAAAPLAAGPYCGAYACENFGHVAMFLIAAASYAAAGAVSLTLPQIAIVPPEESEGRTPRPGGLRNGPGGTRWDRRP
jgi:hypothetical protein